MGISFKFGGVFCYLAIYLAILSIHPTTDGWIPCMDSKPLGFSGWKNIDENLRKVCIVRTLFTLVCNWGKTKKNKIPFINKCKMHSFICSFIQEAREKCCGDWRGEAKDQRASFWKFKKLVGTYLFAWSSSDHEMGWSPKYPPSSGFSQLSRAWNSSCWVLWKLKQSEA